MGSMIHLALGRLELDWGKNNGFSEHSALFQETDVKDVPYYYAGDPLPETAPDGRNWEVVVVNKEGLSKPLAHVLDRLKLLGYTKRYAKMDFRYVLRLASAEDSGLTFEILHDALARVNINELSPDYGDGAVDFGKFFRREIGPRLRIKELVGEEYDEWDVAEAMENLSPYSVMLLVADNVQAKSLPVNWQFNDVAENGWAKRSDFVRPLQPSDRFLIVTEGSSDAHVLRHGFQLLRPHVADFFHYVDMQEGYPFTGTGNVFRFVQGLISISVQNNVVVVYDNDAEGAASFARTQELNVPPNMKIVKLPDMESFESFSTTGPGGEAANDINGRAAAIECYLDLGDSPVVRWSSYNAKLGVYQGELISKEKYTKEFLSHRNRVPGYDYSKLEIVLDTLISICGGMREEIRLEELAEFDEYGLPRDE